MLNRTMGTLDPVVYFENSQGEICLPPTTEIAHQAYEQRYRGEGWEWREAGTLAEVDKLQKKLQALDNAEAQRAVERDAAQFASKDALIRDRLYARLASSATSEWDKEFIRLYLQVREQNRDRFRQRFLERNSYLVAREMDSTHSDAAHLMHAEEGDRWERGV